MFDYLTLHDGPVVSGLEQHETVYAKNQPQYIPMRTLPGEHGNSAIARFHPTEAQRNAIVEGADLYLEILHYRGPLAPSRLMVMSEPQEQATHFLSWWRSQTKGDYALPIPAGAKAENRAQGEEVKTQHQPKEHHMIKLGSEVKHIITGFTGIATARCEYLNGCVQYCVQPQGLDKDGKMQESFYVDDRALTETGQGITLQARPSDGGPQMGTPGAKPAGQR